MFVDFKILGSSINVPYDCQGTDCTVHLRGVDNDNLMSDRKLSEIFLNQTNKYRFKSSLFIYSSTFQGGCGPFFTITETVLEFIENTLHIQRQRTCPENFIVLQHKYKYFYYSLVHNLLINLTSIDRELQRINIMSVSTGVNIENTQIVCPLGMDAVERLPLNTFEQLVYHCEAACTSNMYTFRSGSMTLNEVYHFHPVLWKSLVSNLVNPHCYQCPVGQNAVGTSRLYPIIGVIALKVKCS